MAGERSRGVFVLGTSHRVAPVELRERLAFRAEEVPPALRRLREQSKVEEAVLLSTCNRFELYGASIPDPEEVRGRLLPFLAREKRVESREIVSSLYVRTGREAVEHLFRVASSLDSLVVGETQILGQVREAYGLAREAETVGPRCDPLFRSALRAAREVRRRTAIGVGSVSIASAAVDLAQKIFSDLGSKRVLLVGGGEMAELCLKHLLHAGVRDLVVANRSLEKAARLARDYGGRAAPFAELPGALALADIVVACVASASPCVGLDHLATRRRSRGQAPVFFIDISVPRAVEPSVQEEENVFLYNIDDLEKVIAQNRERRSAAVEGGLRILADAVERFEREEDLEEVEPLLAEMRVSLQEIGDEEWERLARKVRGRVDTQSLEEIRATLRRTANRIFYSAAKAVRDGKSREPESGSP